MGLGLGLCIFPSEWVCLKIWGPQNLWLFFWPNTSAYFGGSPKFDTIHHFMVTSWVFPLQHRFPSYTVVQIDCDWHDVRSRTMKVLIYCALGTSVTSVISQYCPSKKSFEGSTRLLPLPRWISSQVWLVGQLWLKFSRQKKQNIQTVFPLKQVWIFSRIHRILEILQTNLWKTSEQFSMEA